MVAAFVLGFGVSAANAEKHPNCNDPACATEYDESKCDPVGCLESYGWDNLCAALPKCSGCRECHPDIGGGTTNTTSTLATTATAHGDDEGGTCGKVECLKTCFSVSNALQQTQFGAGGSAYGGGYNTGGGYTGGGYTGDDAMDNQCTQYGGYGGGMPGGDDMGGGDDATAGDDGMGGGGMGDQAPETQCMIKNGKCAAPDT